jgi:hypothetical protein
MAVKEAQLRPVRPTLEGKGHQRDRVGSHPGEIIELAVDRGCVVALLQTVEHGQGDALEEREARCLGGRGGARDLARPRQDFPDPRGLRRVSQLGGGRVAWKTLDDRRRGRGRQQAGTVRRLLSRQDLLRAREDSGGGEQREPVGVGSAVPIPREPERGAACQFRGGLPHQTGAPQQDFRQSVPVGRQVVRVVDEMEIGGPPGNGFADLSRVLPLGHVVWLDHDGDRGGDLDRNPGSHLPRGPVQLRGEADDLGPVAVRREDLQGDVLA